MHLLQKRGQTELGNLLAEVHAKGMDSVGASREVAAAIRKSGRVLAGRAVLAEASRERWLRDGVEEIVADSIGTD